MNSAHDHKFLKPTDDYIGYKEDKNDIDGSSNTTFVFNPFVRQSIERQRQRLPVFSTRNHFLFLAERYQTVLVVGETGSGKSTQLPQYLLESDWCKGGIVGITEPRRVAVTNLASRVAEEKESILGKDIGYSIRFDDCTDPEKTKIKYMTEGILVREMMADPLLRQYSAIMLDEVHERTIYTDIILGLMKKILRRRRDLRLIVCSATIDVDLFADFFNMNKSTDKSKDTVGILSIQGREFPIDIFYLKEPIADYVKSSSEIALTIHLKEAMGDILIFLTGVEEVEGCVELIEEACRSKNIVEGSLLALPMHGSLPHSDQLKVFQGVPKTVRKVIVATNIAETSITIENIVYVIDCGFVKLRQFNANTHSSSLGIVPTSKASAKQRAGRAGRVRLGKVFRLYPEEEYENLRDAAPPEMERTDLCPALLTLMALGIDNLLRFPFPSPPPSSHMIAALDDLFALGCLDNGGRLTEDCGKLIAEIPTDTHFAKMLIAARDHDCVSEMLSIVSMLQVQNIYVVPKGNLKMKAKIQHRSFQVYDGDLLTLLNVFSSYVENGFSKKWCVEFFLNRRALRRAAEIRNSMAKLLKKFDIFEDNELKADTDSVCKCIASGLFPNAAFLHASGFYRSVRGNQELHIHPSSVLYYQKQPQWVLYNEILYTSRAFMRDLTVIKRSWLLEAAPHFYEEGAPRYM